MLKNALNYVNELNKKYADTYYDSRYMYYRGCWGTGPLDIVDSTFGAHCLCSVDKDDNVIGYITYKIDYAAKSCSQFGIVSFDIGNPIFARDLREAIDNIFMTYRMYRIEFYCFLDNPVRVGYDRFVKKYGGRVVGILYNNSMLSDGKLHSTIIYELTASEYIAKRGGVKNV